MRVGLLCFALCCCAPPTVTAAQVSFLRRGDADEEVALRLEQLIGEHVELVEAEARTAAFQGLEPVHAARVSIDRDDSTVQVISAKNPGGLSRELDAELMAESPYAVALAAAELLEWLDTSSGSSTSHAPRRRDALGFGLGLDVDFQHQLAGNFSFMRPALHAELAWGRHRPGLFWSAGLRVAAPLGRELRPTAAGERLRANALDAAAQVVSGYTWGPLAITAHLALGVTHLWVEARAPDRSLLGRDARFAPLTAAGLGLRLSVAHGFAFALRGEAQWAGPRNRYRLAGTRALETGPFRLGLLAGLLWESAIAGGSP